MSADAAMKEHKSQSAEASQPRHSGAVRSSIADGTRNPALVAPVHHKGPGSTSGPWQIPSTWRWSTMGAEAEVVGGGTPRTNRSDYFGGDVPWITPADLSGYTEKFIAKGARNITQAGLEGSGAKLMPTGTVLFSSRAPIGYVAIAANPVSTNQGFKSFVLRGNLTPDFVYYYLKHAKKLALELASGTTFQEISGKNAARIPVPVPPLAEQHQIVAEIEKQFTRLDAGVAALRRVQANLKRYRAAVLKSACEGRLVPTEAQLAKAEGRTYETGEQLLTRILADRRKNWRGRGKYKEPATPDKTNLPPLPTGWAWSTAEQLSDENRSITYGVIKLGAHVIGGVPVLRSSDVRHLRLDLEDLKIISPDVANGYQRTFLKGGEILVTVRGTLGGVVVAPDQCAGFNISREVAMLALVEPSMAKAAAIFIGSSPLQRWLTQHAKGIAYTGINIETLKRLPVPLPPLVEQSRIAAEVERRLSMIEKLETTVLASLYRATRLRRSVLRKTFS